MALPPSSTLGSEYNAHTESAEWAIRFYERNGFRCVSTEEKNRLLRTYWEIPERQVETSVVLASSPPDSS